MKDITLCIPVYGSFFYSTVYLIRLPISVPHSFDPLPSTLLSELPTMLLKAMDLCFLLLIMINKLPVNILLYALLWTYASASLEYLPRRRITFFIEPSSKK